ncbi:hypothetical protein [Yoonia sp.]|uniref:hypothetical protein n=1 Tax=Yoonia sp. TaxID=2212373 RepID=UPI002897AE92|nr:hypothetical protein [Yoonia sp.]
MFGIQAKEFGILSWFALMWRGQSTTTLTFTISKPFLVKTAPFHAISSVVDATHVRTGLLDLTCLGNFRRLQDVETGSLLTGTLAAPDRVARHGNGPGDYRGPRLAAL